MNKKRNYFFFAVTFVVYLSLQVVAISAFAQVPGGASGPGAGGPRRGPALPPIPLAEDTTHTLTKSFTQATNIKKAPDADGFIQRWLVLEPIKKNDRTNSQLTEGYLRETFASANNFSTDYNVVPKSGEKVKIGNQELKWYALDSKSFNFNLHHFSYATNTTRNGVLFWLVTVVNCAQDIKNVRLAAGPNSAGGFWVNGKEVLVVPGDKDVIADLATSPLFTLKKGKNVVRVAIMNGQGMVNFCVRFLDENGKPVKNYTLSVE
ncbi:acetylxylan esterase [Mucilaginibacter auburnensis]|uniref:Acetylxylan esterase n=1 Tax=Mucilaginibacter auburnensis TaxID=1457233 RepID=A0A2H9VTG1_9SPHI|nr:acetylxylan esterase [Mucilaginibacter auburnensis]PJJ84115.1 hypothetical protein CLV57_1119 [Mucilaginibacter auburnensis]